MSFLIKDDELLEKYNEIWEKVKYSLKGEFDNKPVFNKKYLNAKIKYHYDFQMCFEYGSAILCQ